MTHELKELFDKDGKHISPQLGEDVKNYLIDIDGTITEDVPNEEPERMVTCEPWLDAHKIINEWYDEGHIITFFTSRTIIDPMSLLDTSYHPPDALSYRQVLWWLPCKRAGRWAPPWLTLNCCNRGCELKDKRLVD